MAQHFSTDLGAFNVRLTYLDVISIRQEHDLIKVHSLTFSNIELLELKCFARYYAMLFATTFNYSVHKFFTS